MRPFFITAGAIAAGLIAAPSQAQTCSSTVSVQGYDIVAEHKLDVWMFNSEYTDAEAQQIVASIEATLNKMLDKEAAGQTLGRTYLCYRLIHSFDITYRLVDQLTADERNRFTGDKSFHDPDRKTVLFLKTPAGQQNVLYDDSFFPWNLFYAQAFLDNGADSILANHAVYAMSNGCHFPMRGYDAQCESIAKIYRDWYGIKELPLAYANIDTANNSSCTEGGIMVLTDDGLANESTLAHEFLHTLGVDHNPIDENLMNAGKIKRFSVDQRRIHHSSLHEYLDDQGLRCEWTLRIPDFNYENDPSCSLGESFSFSMQGEALITLRNQGLDLEGELSENITAATYENLFTTGPCGQWTCNQTGSSPSALPLQNITDIDGNTYGPGRLNNNFDDTDSSAAGGPPFSETMTTLLDEFSVEYTINKGFDTNGIPFFSTENLEEVTFTCDPDPDSEDCTPYDASFSVMWAYLLENKALDKGHHQLVYGKFPLDRFFIKPEGTPGDNDYSPYFNFEEGEVEFADLDLDRRLNRDACTTETVSYGPIELMSVEKL